MDSIKNKIEQEIKRQYPKAEIVAYYESTGEMIFYPYPEMELTGSCIYHNGKFIINFDF